MGPTPETEAGLTGLVQSVLTDHCGCRIFRDGVPDRPCPQCDEGLSLDDEIPGTVICE